MPDFSFNSFPYKKNRLNEAWSWSSPPFSLFSCSRLKGLATGEKYKTTGGLCPKFSISTDSGQYCGKSVVIRASLDCLKTDMLCIIMLVNQCLNLIWFSANQPQIGRAHV